MDKQKKPEAQKPKREAMTKFQDCVFAPVHIDGHAIELLRDTVEGLRTVADACEQVVALFRMSQIEVPIMVNVQSGGDVEIAGCHVRNAPRVAKMPLAREVNERTRP